ncbi:hypothetical protein [Actinoplanes sp. NPDC051494]|uniref:hypothetical protein n=1 Tax=Actinoplanes sp. NPDC051494 TaxID=3363907 RepID=UPI00379092C7
MIGFLHTAEVHVATFRDLVRELAPDVEDRHLVDPTLLADADAPDLEQRLRAHLQELADGGARVIVCTCSTLGELAERLDVGVPVLRVDRPMAEAAVAAGRRIGVLYAVKSTLAPTLSLLTSVRRDHTEFVEAPCFDAWALFEAGDLDGYARRIAAHARTLEVDVILLAQASMAPAEELLADLRKPVFSSPRTAIQRALTL